MSMGDQERDRLVPPESAAGHHLLRQPDSDNPLDWALYYAARGLKVFPVYDVVRADGALRCRCGKADCETSGKHPRTPHGFHDASTDEHLIRLWWSEWPNANVAIRTGDGSVVLDVDVDKGGDESLQELERKYGQLPTTRQALTGSGGEHYWFRTPEGAPVGCFNGFEYGLDVRGDGGYVVVEPSVHRTGNVYRWDGLAGFDEPVAELPIWLLNLLAARRDRNGDGAEPWKRIDIQVNRNPQLPPELLEFIQADADLSALWNVRREDFADHGTGRPNFSRYDLGLASHFLKAGLTHQQVADILTAFRLKHGNPKGKAYRLDYIQRTIWAASRGSDSAGARGSAADAERAAHDIAEGTNTGAERPMSPDANTPTPAIGAAKPTEMVPGTNPPADKATATTAEPKQQTQAREPGIEEPQEPNHPYRQIRGGLSRVKKGKDGGEEYVPLSNFTARISSDIGEDDGAEVRRFFGITAMAGPKAYSFIVPANKFAGMDWPIENIGPNAIVQPNVRYSPFRTGRMWWNPGI